MKNHIFKVEAKRGSYSAGFYIGILVLTAAGIIGAGDLKDAMGEIYKLFEDKEELPAYTPHTILTVSELIHEAEKVKKQGRE